MRQYIGAMLSSGALLIVSGCGVRPWGHDNTHNAQQAAISRAVANSPKASIQQQGADASRQTQAQFQSDEESFDLWDLLDWVDFG
jgi:hypothetical protein